MIVHKDHALFTKSYEKDAAALTFQPLTSLPVASPQEHF